MTDKRRPVKEMSDEELRREKEDLGIVTDHKPGVLVEPVDQADLDRFRELDEEQARRAKSRESHRR
jgi:hypothetical protein